MARRDPLMQDAATLADEQYAPERQALADLLSQAEQDLSSGVKLEQGMAQGVAAAARAARPQVTKAYREAGRTASQARADLSADLSKLGEAADPFRAASARDAAGSRVRLAEAMTHALGELSAREGDAKAGAQYAVRSLAGRTAQARGEIGAKQVALAGRQGLTTANNYSQLRKESQAELRANRTEDRLAAGDAERARHNRATEAGGPKGNDPRAPKPLTPKMNSDALDGVNTARTLIRRFKGSQTSTQIRAMLATGPTLSQTDPERPKGAKVREKIPQIDQNLVNIAFDLEVRGGLSKLNLKNAERAGINIPAQWRKPPRPKGTHPLSPF